MSCRVCFEILVLVPLPGAAARCVASCALELSCGVPLPDVWLRALWSLDDGAGCRVRFGGWVPAPLLLSGVYAGVVSQRSPSSTSTSSSSSSPSSQSLFHYALQVPKVAKSFCRNLSTASHPSKSHAPKRQLQLQG